MTLAEFTIHKTGIEKIIGYTMLTDIRFILDRRASL
jgi:hypothetical protein